MNYKRIGYKSNLYSDGTENEYKCSIEELNSDNQVLCGEYLDDDGKLNEKITYCYNDDKKIRESVLFNNLNELVQKDEYEYTHNDSGEMIITQIRTYTDKTIDKFIETYMNNIKTRSQYYSDGHLEEEEVYILENNKLMNYLKKDSTGNIVEKEVYTHESDKMIIEKYTDDQLIKRETLLLENGNIVEVNYETDYSDTKEVNTYDVDNNLIDKTFYEEGKCVAKISREYANKKLIKETREVFSPNSIIHMPSIRQYEYDSMDRISTVQNNDELIRYEYSMN